MAKNTQVVKVYTSTTPVWFLLFLTFLILKLCGVIAWSWWWVTAPIWIPAALGLTIFAGVLVIGLIIAILAAVIGGSFLKKLDKM